MFGAMRCFMMLKSNYAIQFEEVLTDNGSEFGNRSVKNKTNHPFERLLTEMGIKHLNTRPYRPQTNGKIERFWKTLYEDLLEDTDFASLSELKEELFQYLAYYNHERTTRPSAANQLNCSKNYPYENYKLRYRITEHTQHSSEFLTTLDK